MISAYAFHTVMITIPLTLLTIRSNIENNGTSAVPPISLETTADFTEQPPEELTTMTKDESPAEQISSLLHVEHPVWNQRSWREQFIAQKVLNSKNYDPNVRPPGSKVTANLSEENPVIVYTTLFLKGISSINDAQMEFGAQFRFQQEWIDSRLRFDNMGFSEIPYINLAHDQRVWIPDTFFQNEKRGRYHDVDKPNLFLRVSPDGKIAYNRRYPHDIQYCVMDFATYAYTTKDIEYVWSKDAIVLDSGTQLRPKFFIDYVRNSTCTSVTATGTYSCLRIELKLRRVFSFFLLQLYIPSIMLVAVSCVSYWIDWKATAARVPLAIVTLLAMITQSHALNASLPPVSYTKAVDLWIGTCTIFIFSALIEYAIVNYIGVHDERRRAKARDMAGTQQVCTTFFVNPAPLDSIVSAEAGPPTPMLGSQPTRYTMKLVDFEEMSVPTDQTPLSKYLRRRKNTDKRRRREFDYEVGAFAMYPVEQASETYGAMTSGGAEESLLSTPGGIASAGEGWFHRWRRRRHRKHVRETRGGCCSAFTNKGFNGVYWTVYW